MPEYLRVRDENGAEFSVVASAFEPHSMTVLKTEAAADRNGDPLPDKPAEPKTGKASTAPKENS